MKNAIQFLLLLGFFSCRSHSGQAHTKTNSNPAPTTPLTHLPSLSRDAMPSGSECTVDNNYDLNVQIYKQEEDGRPQIITLSRKRSYINLNDCGKGTHKSCNYTLKIQTYGKSEPFSMSVKGGKRYIVLYSKKFGWYFEELK